MSLPRVLLADDSAAVLEVMKQLLKPEFEVVGTVQDGVSLVAAAQKLDPDVMIVDVAMPGLSGFEAAKQLRKSHVRGIIVFLSFHEDVSFIAEARSIGTMGYVFKSSANQDLVVAIHEALEGRFFVSPRHDHREIVHREES